MCFGQVPHREGMFGIHRRRRFSKTPIELLEQRVLLAASPIRVGDVAFFQDSAQPRIHRYDIGIESWLTPVVLQGATSASDVFHVDANGIYAAFGKDVVRFDADGSHRTFVLTSEFPVEAIHSDGNILFVSQVLDSQYSEFISLNKSTNAVIHRFSTFYDVLDSVISVEFNRIIGRNRSIPSDITFVSYGDDGRFNGAGDSPYHGNFPAAQKTWISPDGASAIDDSGTIYTIDTLKHRLSIGTSLTDLEFYGKDVPIALSGRMLVALDQAFRQTGSVVLDHSPSEIFVGTSDVLTFTEDATTSNDTRCGPSRFLN